MDAADVLQIKDNYVSDRILEYKIGCIKTEIENIRNCINPINDFASIANSLSVLNHHIETLPVQEITPKLLEELLIIELEVDNLLKTSLDCDAKLSLNDSANLYSLKVRFEKFRENFLKAVSIESIIPYLECFKLKTFESIENLVFSDDEIKNIVVFYANFIYPKIKNIIEKGYQKTEINKKALEYIWIFEDELVSRFSLSHLRRKNKDRSLLFELNSGRKVLLEDPDKIIDSSYLQNKRKLITDLEFFILVLGLSIDQLDMLRIEDRPVGYLNPLTKLIVDNDPKMPIWQDEKMLDDLRSKTEEL